MDKDFIELKKYSNWFCSNCMHPQEVGYCENNCYKKCLPKIENKIKVLVALKDLFDFDFALRFPSNQPMLKITNKLTFEDWEIPITQKLYNLLKEVFGND